MKRIYKNTDLNFPINVLPEMTSANTLTIRFFTRKETNFIEKKNADITDNHILLEAHELLKLEEGVLNVIYTVSTSGDGLSDDSYDVEIVKNTEYYIANGNTEITNDDDTFISDYLNDYYTKVEIDSMLENVDVDLSGYATLDELHVLSGEMINNELAIAASLTDLNNRKADKTDIPSLDGYAKEQWVNEQIDAIDVTDKLDDYYTKDEVDNAIQNVDIDLSGFCYKKILTQSEYDALQEKNPQTIYIISDALDTGGSGNVDLSNYYTKSEVDDKVANVTVDLTGYAREQWVNEQFEAYEMNLTEYAKETWVKEQNYLGQKPVTQAEYNALPTKEENVMYIITDVPDEWVGTQDEYNALPEKNDLTTYYIIQE